MMREMVVSPRVERTSPTRELLMELIARGGIVPHFQPIVDLFTGEVFGYELLSRAGAPFEDPTTMFQSAKGWGLSWDLEYACRKACLKRVAEVAGRLPSARFTLNVSPDILSDPRFTGGFTLRTIRELGVDIGQLIIEITETATVNDRDRFEGLVRHYVDQGFQIALDDFGIGNSGLSTLVTVAPHFIKLDRSIVEGIEQNAYKQNIVKAMVSLAGTVESHLIAEGIESTAQLLTVFRLGVRYAQGYLFGRPAPEPAAIDPRAAIELHRMIDDFMHKPFTIEETSISRMITYPESFQAATTSCETLETEFRRNHSLDHVVVLDGGQALGLITRQAFFAAVSGQYGYAVYQRRFIDEVAKREFLSVDEEVDIRALGRLALGRSMSDLYDPIVVTDADGAFLGTITMRQLLAVAMDVEIKIATSLNPLTRLPGNIIITHWLEEIFKLERYSVIYADLSRFKEFNERYGLMAGDDLIRATAQILTDFLPRLSADARLGHLGGDDFIIVADALPTEAALAALCTEFDAGRERFFSSEEIANGWYPSTDRSGRRAHVPLATLTLAVVTSDNFDEPPRAGQISRIAVMLKRRSKHRGESRSVSHHLFERRRYSRGDP